MQYAYFAERAKRTLQAALKETKIKNLFKTLKDKEADTEKVINNSVAGVETLLDMITIALQNKRENNPENPSSHEDSVTPLFNKGKAKSNKPQV